MSHREKAKGKKSKGKKAKPERTPLRRFFNTLPAWAFSALLMILGFVALSTVKADLWNGYGSEAWPTVEGEVSYRDVEWSDSDMHTPVVKYSYEVEGRQYTSERILFGAHTGIKKDAELVASRYKEQPVQVYYHPKKPSLSVLEPGVDLYYHAPALIAGIVILILSLGCFWGSRFLYMNNRDY